MLSFWSRLFMSTNGCFSSWYSKVLRHYFPVGKLGLMMMIAKCSHPGFFVINMRSTKHIVLCFLNSTGITLTLRGILTSTMESRKFTYSLQISGFQIFCCTTSKLIFALFKGKLSRWFCSIFGQNSVNIIEYLVENAPRTPSLKY